MADQWTTAQLNRIARALELAGYRDAGIYVAIAAHAVSMQRSRLRRQMRRSYLRAIAARDRSQATAVVVPFPARRRAKTDRRDE
jgi:hypothetical protein